MSKENSSRRQFLIHGVTVGVAAGGLSACGERSSTSMSMLQALVDTIVPTDTSPGALDYALDEEVQLEVERSTKLASQLGALIEYLQATSEQAFEKKPLEQREAQLLSLLQDASRPPARTALRSLRRLVLNLYYTRAEVQQSLGYPLAINNPFY